MKLRTENKVGAGFGFALALLLLIAAVSYFNASRSVQAFRVARNTSSVMAELERLLLGTLDVESGSRGFAATGNKTYLERYESGRVVAQQAYRNVEEALARDSEYKGRLDRLEGLITSQMAIAEELVAAKNDGPQAGFNSLPNEEGNNAVDQLRATVADMEKIEGGLLAERENGAETSARATMWIIVVTASVALAVVTTAGLLVRHDLLKRKQVEDERDKLNSDLRKQAQQLTDANKELEAFCYSVSHDLRAPLRHIDGYVARLRKLIADKLDEKGQHYLKTVSASAKEMGQLIDDLLVFSRVGRIEMQRTGVDLSVLLQQAMMSAHVEANGRNIEWKQSPLPVVKGDPALLKQVFLNLISNAVKYTRPRDPARIEIGQVGEPNGETVVFVKDNGVGFEMEYAHKLFGVFQRLHRSDEFEGTGVGLANVRRIIQRHGGRTWAEGEVGNGATFYFSLPMKEKEQI